MAKKYQFDITPHIVKQLGEELVSDEITALMELIKNSYDADASYVSIEINTTGTYLKDTLHYPNRKGFIVVEDDGFGMSEKTILKSWLLISFSDKRSFKEKKLKTPKGRTPLGDKGLGRLSTQRLANICEIYTNEKGKIGTHIAFNWKDFETEKALSNVKISAADFPAKPKGGTTLVLSDLNHSEVWEGKNLERFKGQISQIISPFKENRPFEVYVTINDQTIDLEKSNDELRKLAVSRFKFEFDGNFLEIKGKTKIEKFITGEKEDYQNYILADNGKKFYSFVNSHKKYSYIKFVEKLKEEDTNLKANEISFFDDTKFFIGFKNRFDVNSDISKLEIYDGTRANPGPFEGQIDEFSYDRNFINEVFSELANYAEFAKSQAGIKVFRNGFAVRPFGINEDDWLNLSTSQTSGSSYHLRPKNVIGYFAIDEGENSNLKDKTDREGLVSNAYSRNFYVLAGFIVDEINRYQEGIRRAYNDFLKAYKSESSGIKTVTQAFNQLKETKAKTKEVRAEFDNAIKTVEKAINDSQNIILEVKSNPLFTTDLEKSTVNKVDEILNELLIIQGTLKKLNEVVKRGEKLNEVIDILEPKIKILEEQLDNFSELAGLGLTTESVSHEFASIADRLAEKSSFYSNKLQNKKLTDSDTYVLFEYINSTVNGLKIQLKHLDPSLKYNKERKNKISMSGLLKDEIEYYSNRFEKNKIEFNVTINDNFNIVINKGKLIQIIDNILNNSEYWLLEKKSVESDFLPRIDIKIEKPWVYVYDNGYGIAPAIENQIFEPFVTTKPKEKGRGLGLFIVQQLLDSAGCTIILEPEKNKQDRKYIFAINLSNVIE